MEARPLVTNTMCLGLSWVLTNGHEEELPQRIERAWTMFCVYRQELTNKAVPTRLRLRCFQSVVTPTIFHGCSLWVLTAGREQRLLRMLRTVLSDRKRVDGETGVLECWTSWVTRDCEWNGRVY